MLTTWINGKIVGSVVRHLMTVAGTFLVAEGYTDEATWQTVTGGTVALASIALGVAEKRFRF